MQEAVFYFTQQAYEQSLKLCVDALNENEDNILALELAFLSALKLSYTQKSFEFALLFHQKQNSKLSSLYLARAYNIQENASAGDFSYYELSLNLLEAFVFEDEILEEQRVNELHFLYFKLGYLEKLHSLFETFLQKYKLRLDFWEKFIKLYENYPLKALELCNNAYEVLFEELKHLQAQNENLPLSYEKAYANLDLRLNGLRINDEKIKNIILFINTKLLVQKAFMLFKLYKNKEALALFEELKPYNENNADFWAKFAKSLELASSYQKAITAYQKALSIHAHATYHFDLAYLLMRKADFKRGIFHYEKRLFYAYKQAFAENFYEQACLAFIKDAHFFENKRIFVYCEQGLGDTMMYSRFLQKLCKHSKEVLFAPQSDLCTLFKTNLKLLNKEDKKRAKSYENLKILADVPNALHFDYALPLCSLPYFLGIKDAKELLTFQAPLIKKTIKKLKTKKKLGFFFYSQMAVTGTITRNCDANFILEALKGLDCELVSLQVGDFDFDAEIVNKGKDFKDFNDTYEALLDLDLVVSIDCALAHLSLNLEIPTIVLLAPYFDWRFGLFEKPKSLFYEKDFPFVFKEWQSSVLALRALAEKILNEI